ncbi:hypothetical protein [uncultured Algibacter sp.]|uniref:hypothetical protein n=1 Tax=uncultured Algibacter sp. TaxID=298659 RepID=UPI002612B631|nr:hypothetical protein [uncultured Algibacter sp.]
MKKLNLIFGVLIGLSIISCSSDDVSESRNGFTYNGVFYETNFAKSNSQSSAFDFIFCNPLDHNLPEGQFGRFSLDSGTDIEDGPLVKGKYSTENGRNHKFGIHGYLPIHFQDNSNQDEVDITTGYWFQDERFVSGDVTINSITSTEDNLVNEINLDYSFKWNSVTVVGHYEGVVNNNL